MRHHHAEDSNASQYVEVAHMCLGAALFHGPSLAAVACGVYKKDGCNEP